VLPKQRHAGGELRAIFEIGGRAGTLNELLRASQPQHAPPECGSRRI
jgi:hypothetical protein